MKRFSAVVALLLLGSIGVAAQTDSQMPQLVISAELLSQQYCANSPVMTTMQMRVRLRYTNTGTQKIILYRGDDLFYQAEIRSVRAEGGARP